MIFCLNAFHAGVALYGQYVLAKLFIFAGNFCNISVFIQCENKVELVTGFEPVNQLQVFLRPEALVMLYLDVIVESSSSQIIAEDIIAVFACDFDIILAMLGKLTLCLCYLTCDFVTSSFFTVAETFMVFLSL